MPAITAQEVFEMLPEFKAKLDAVLSAPRSENEWEDYERAKSLMAQNVGRHATDPRVQSSEAYDAVLDYICERLNV